MSGIAYNTIDEALAALRAGKMIIVVDAKERENEGDFVCAAEKMTPEIASNMLRFGMGQFCAPLTQEYADRLHLTPLVEQNTTSTQCAFLIPVDHRDSGTGVSPENRSLTIRALCDPHATARDFVRGGHVSPLLAKEGGVLRRAGHTEATVDLLRMAGLRPVGAIIEICSQKTMGMADHEELQALALQFDIPIISIEELIRHRRLREQLVKRVVATPMPLKHGSATVIAYQVDYEDQEPFAIVFGDLSSVKAPLVRMHSSCFTGDVLDSLRCDCGDQLHMALDMIRAEGVGAIVYLPQEGRGIGLVAKLQAYVLQDEGYDTIEANHKLGFKADVRDYMVGLQILKDLGLTEIRLLTNNPKKIDSFVDSAFDIRLVEQIPLVAPPHAHRARYMATKRERMGHLLPPEGNPAPNQDRPD